jgi:hypothetical protein
VGSKRAFGVVRRRRTKPPTGQGLDQWGSCATLVATGCADPAPGRNPRRCTTSDRGFSSSRLLTCRPTDPTLALPWPCVKGVSDGEHGGVVPRQPDDQRTPRVDPSGVKATRFLGRPFGRVRRCTAEFWGFVGDYQQGTGAVMGRRRHWCRIINRAVDRRRLATGVVGGGPGWGVQNGTGGEARVRHQSLAISDQ